MSISSANCVINGFGTMMGIAISLRSFLCAKRMVKAKLSTGSHRVPYAAHQESPAWPSAPSYAPITGNAHWYAVELHMERLVWMALQQAVKKTKRMVGDQ